MATIPAKPLKGADESANVDRIPDSCPICHKSVSPLFVTSALVGAGPTRTVQSVYRCPSVDCQSLYFAVYAFKQGSRQFSLQELKPRTPSEPQYSSEIRELSPTFVEIMEQVAVAQANELSQPEGIGLRKALEFLVKDFAISQHLDQEDEIRGKPLAACIRQYLTAPNVQACAERAAWLGNDETHYTRKWQDRDVRDLQILVRLTVMWLEGELLTGQYIEEMDRQQAT